MSPDILRFFRPRESKSYIPNLGKTYTETWFGRGNLALEILDTRILKTNKSPDVLLVGVGLHGHYGLECCYEPYRFFAHLESAGVNFTMTLVDNDEAVINDIERRRSIYVPNVLNDDTQNSWEKYLTQTGQTSSSPDENDTDLIIHPIASFIGIHTWQRHEIQKAGIPPGFTDRLKDETVRLVHNDIAVANFGEDKFDFCKLENVLYLLSPLGQRLALENISSSLNTGGIILFDDQKKRNISPDTPLLRENGGWLDNGTIRKMGLELETITRDVGELGLEVTGILVKR